MLSRQLQKITISERNAKGEKIISYTEKGRNRPPTLKEETWRGKMMRARFHAERISQYVMRRLLSIGNSRP